MPQVINHPLVVECHCLFKDSCVWIERNCGPVTAIRFTNLLEWRFYATADKFDSVQLTLLHHFGNHKIGQCVHHTGTNTVQTRRYLISTAAELTTGVQHGQYSFKRTKTCLWVLINRDSAAVVRDGDAAIFQDSNIDT